jgi:hypothetical protein
MNFLVPWAAWFAAGVPVIVLLYLLKLKRRPVQVSTLLFWQRVLREQRRRALFQRLRHLLSLLLHLLIFLLILAALARPEFDRFIRAGSSVVIVMDTRARMQTHDDAGETRFPDARKQALALIRRASHNRQVALVAAGAVPDVLVPFTADQQALSSGLNGLSATDASGDLSTSIRLADDLLAARQGAREIVVFTSGEAGKATNTRAGLTVRNIGRPAENIGITRFAARPLPNSPQTFQVLLELRNFSSKPARGNTEISLDGRVTDVRPFDLPPGASRTEVFALLPSRAIVGRGWLTAELDTKDALAADDSARVALPAAITRHVLLVSSGSFFLEKLLAADDLTRFELLKPESFRPEIAAQFDAVILDRAMPPGLNLATARGNLLFIGETPFDGEEIEMPLIVETDPRDPLLRLVHLENVTLLSGRKLSLPAERAGWNFATPVRGIDAPLVVTATRPTDSGEQRLAAFGFDPARSDLPLRVAFPLLISNTIQWLAGRDSEPPASIRAGELIELPPGRTISSVPADTTGQVAGSEIAGTFRPERNGFHRVRAASGDSWLAVNTFDAAESNLAVAPADDLPGAPHAGSPWKVHAAARPPWVLFALAALVLFAIEWWLFHRRRTE